MSKSKTEPTKNAWIGFTGTIIGAIITVLVPIILIQTCNAQDAKPSSSRQNSVDKPVNSQIYQAQGNQTITNIYGDTTKKKVK